MAEEKIFLDETFPIVKYNNTAPLAGLPLLKRRENAQVANVRVIVTDKRIMVDEKMTVLANIAAVSVGDDEKEVVKHNFIVNDWENSEIVKKALNVKKFFKSIAWLLCGFIAYNAVKFPSASEFFRTSVAITVIWVAVRWQMKNMRTPPAPPVLTPDYAVVIESAGTRDNALVSKDRMAVQKIVRAISDALVSRA